MRVADDLRAEELAENRTGEYVARPMLVEVHARKSGHQRRAIQHRPDNPLRMRIVRAQLAHDGGGGGEARGRVKRGIRPVRKVTEPFSQLEIVAVVDTCSGTGASERRANQLA